MKCSIKYFVGLILLGIFIYMAWYNTNHTATPLVDFVYERDIEDSLRLFDDNWYWMFPEPKEEYPEGYVRYVLKYQAPQANPLYHHALTIKVLRLDNHVVGIVGYYKESNKIGRLLYVLVDKKYRGKGYGEQLAKHGLSELLTTFSCDRVNLVTRIDNAPAQHIYKKIGFKQIRDDGDGLVHFAYFR